MFGSSVCFCLSDVIEQFCNRSVRFFFPRLSLCYRILDSSIDFIDFLCMWNCSIGFVGYQIGTAQVFSLSVIGLCSLFRDSFSSNRYLALLLLFLDRKRRKISD